MVMVSRTPLPSKMSSIYFLWHLPILKPKQAAPVDCGLTVGLPDDGDWGGLGHVRAKCCLHYIHDNALVQHVLIGVDGILFAGFHQKCPEVRLIGHAEKAGRREPHPEQDLP